MNQTANTSQQSTGAGTKFLAGIGVIALAAVAIWLGVQALQLGAGFTGNFAASILSVRSLFGGTEELVLRADPGVVSPDDTFVLSWEHEEAPVGSYTFSYECTQGVHLASPMSANTDDVIFCDMPFPIEGEVTTLTLRAVSINEDPTEVPLRIEFTPSDSERVTAAGNTSITVVHDSESLAVIAGTGTSTTERATPEVAPRVTTTPAPRPTVTTTVVTPPTSDLNGTPDLTISFLAVGTVSTSGQFTSQSEPLDPDERLAIRFVVQNIGTKVSDPWRFEAKLPTEPRRDYRSPEQEGLMPGASVEYTLGFDNAEDDDERITIDVTLDADENIDEVNENNNNLRISFDIQ